MEANLSSPEASVLSWISSNEKSSEQIPSTLDQENKALERIENYQPTRQDDYAKSILTAFMKYLPWEARGHAGSRFLHCECRKRPAIIRFKLLSLYRYSSSW
jgi:hypothetical protein